MTSLLWFFVFILSSFFEARGVIPEWSGEVQPNLPREERGGAHLTLPRVEFFGGALSRGVTDLRSGVALYEQWILFSQGKPSVLSTLPKILKAPSESGREPSLQRPVKKFTFQDGTIIYLDEGRGIVGVATLLGGGIFQLRISSWGDGV